MNYQEKVKEFHKALGLPVSEKPTLINRKQLAVRLRLITEELSEYCEAVAAGDIVEISDALGDLLYVVFGTVVEHGLPMDEIFNQIHASNMSKIGAHKDKGGKIVKPDTYEPVNLSWVALI